MNDLVQLKNLSNLELEEVIQYENSERDRPEFDNKYLKIVYFILNEGPLNTLRKYLAHRQPQKRYLTILIAKYENQTYLNVSVQSQKNPDNFIIDNEFYRYEGINLDSISIESNEYLEHFNQFSGSVDYRLLNVKPQQPISFKKKSITYSEEFDSGLFIFGLGGYVRMFIMHHFKKFNKIACVDYKAHVAEDFKKKYGFKFSFLVPSDTYPLLNRVKNPVVIIATYHSDHARLAKEAFLANSASHIFIEKPPTVKLEDLEILSDLYRKGAKLEIGFNRRFIPFSQFVKNRTRNKKVIINCSIKEVLISDNHWYLWRNQGTRITGNIVHWFDLANFWIDDIPTEISVMAHPDDLESSAISVIYKNGSILNITASDKGNSMRGVQEIIEIRYDNETIFINDFKYMTFIGKNGVKHKIYKIKREKGHKIMYRNFKSIIHGKLESKYTYYDLIRTSVLTFSASEMIKKGEHHQKIERLVRAFIE